MGGLAVKCINMGDASQEREVGALDVCTRRTCRGTERGDGFRVEGMTQAKAVQ